MVSQPHKSIQFFMIFPFIVIIEIKIKKKHTKDEWNNNNGPIWWKKQNEEKKKTL